LVDDRMFKEIEDALLALVFLVAIWVIVAKLI
jgi:hypothetical protein